MARSSTNRVEKKTGTKKTGTKKAETKKASSRGNSHNSSTVARATKSVSPKNVIQEDVEKPGMRYFKAIYRLDDEIGFRGRYGGVKPKQAANKVISALRRNMDLGDGDHINFAICECTRGSRKKIYTYTGFQETLDTPVEVPITRKDGTVCNITYRRQNTVHKVSNEDCQDLVDFYLEQKGGSKNTTSKKTATKTSRKSSRKTTTKTKKPAAKKTTSKASMKTKAKKPAAKKPSRKVQSNNLDK